jgi:sucrose phosphorylase
MLNAYPDSIGEKFSDTVDMLKMTEFRMFFFALYAYFFFNSDLDRGFLLLI